VKQSYHSKFCWLNVYVLSIFGCFLFAQEAQAESKEAKFDRTNAQLSLKRSLDSSLKASTSARDLLAQQRITRVTGVEINQTDRGLELILKTAAGSQRLVPLILPEGNDLVIDLLDATLGFSIRNGVNNTNPAPGIKEVNLVKIDESSIRLTITGANQAPSAEVIPGSNLVLSVTPQGNTTAQKPDREIEVIATGEAENDDYYVPEASSATRTDTAIRDIPQSIQIVPQQVLEDRKTIRLTDAVSNVSGVSVGNSFGGTINSFNIRGFADASILRDGFKETFTESGLSTDLADVEQIEVLKGPASVLYGYVEPGGAINQVTKKPLDNPFYNLDLSIGSNNFYRPSLDFSGPLTLDKDLRYRLNFAYQNADSFRDFVSSERVFIAPVLDFDISDRTTISLNTSYLYDDRTLDRGIVAIADGVADIPIERFLGEPGDFREVNQFSLGYRLEHEFNDKLKLRNRFQFLDSDESNLNTNAGELDEATGNLFRDYFNSENEYKIYAMQTDLTSEFKTGSVDHQLLFGFDLQRNTVGGFFKTPSDAFDYSVENRQTPTINVFNPIYNLRPPDTSTFILQRDDLATTDNLGIFLQDQIAITDNLKLLAGGRFDILTQKLDDKLNDIESSESKNAFSPRLGIVYQPIQPLSLYASYSRSFAPNSGTLADGSLLKPTRGTQYEAGMRIALNPSLAATLAAYEITKTNISTTDPINSAFSIAVGEQRSRGIELDVSGEVLPGWSIISAYSYTDAEIIESNDYPVGTIVPNVPSNQFSIWTTYELQKGSWKGLGMGLGLFYVDTRQGDLENSYEVPSYTRTDVAVYYERNNWRAGINFQNLFDVRHFENSDLGRTTVIPGAPFTVLGSVAVEF
jgi:iron complex outermembrane recepter protein